MNLPARATEYSKAATKGNWNDVWASPTSPSLSRDNRAKAKKGGAANEGDRPGLFGDVGAGAQAAE